MVQYMTAKNRVKGLKYLQQKKLDSILFMAKKYSLGLYFHVIY